MSLRHTSKCLLLAAFSSGPFSFSLRGCGWSSIEIYSIATFFCIGLVISLLTFRLSSKLLFLFLATILLPILGGWLYSLMGIFSPGELSVGPCVERSTWIAFPALYSNTSGSALLNPKLWLSRTATAAMLAIFATSTILFLRSSL